MKIKCIANTGESLSEQSLSLGYKPTTIFEGLEINKDYIVYGISLELDTTNYLLFNGKKAIWYPAELFVIINDVLPLVWFFNFFGYEKYPTAISGYKELVLDPSHNVDLMEGKLEAVEIFLKRKEKIDEYEEFNRN